MQYVDRKNRILLKVSTFLKRNISNILFIFKLFQLKKVKPLLLFYNFGFALSVGKRKY